MIYGYACQLWISQFVTRRELNEIKGPKIIRVCQDLD